MAWSRLEPGCTQHVKRVKSGPIPSWVWICCIDYSTVHLTDGFVDSAALPGLCPALRPAQLKRAIQTLVEVGSLERVAGGVKVHGYLDHNSSRAEVETDRQAARRRFDRWKDKQRGSDTVGNGAAPPLPTQHPNGGATDPSVGRSVSQSVDTKTEALSRDQINETWKHRRPQGSPA